jgi:hypothetical protein
MPDISRARIRRAAGRLRRKLASDVESVRLRELTQHIAHIERRLHVAEHKVKQLVDAGFTTEAPTDAASYARWLTWRPPGHRSSPVPNLHELQAHEDLVWPEKLPTELPGIDLRADAQLQTFTQVAKLARALEIYERQTEPWRYYSDNVSYSVGDALTLHGMLRLIRPERLIEIGGGHSSAMTLDTVEHFLGGRTELTFIEPSAEQLDSVMRHGDRQHVTIVATPLQQVPLDTFATLQSGDVLFVDSSHVLKTGSDVAWLYGSVLPSLADGVHVHIHDMFYPFEYPKEWVMEGRAWNEVYVVRAFLALNPSFEISLFNSWLAYFHHDLIERELPEMLTNTVGALWLRRVRPPT